MLVAGSGLCGRFTFFLSRPDFQCITPRHTRGGAGQFAAFIRMHPNGTRVLMVRMLTTHTHTAFFCNFLSLGKQIALLIVRCLKFDLKSFSNKEYRNVLCAAWTEDVFTQLNFLVLFDCCTERTQTCSAETAQNLKWNFKINFPMDLIVLQFNVCP